MANFGRVKTWGNETLTAGDLNSEFDNIINNVTSGSVSAANVDLTDGYAWTGAHTFAVDLKVLNGAGVIVGNTAQVTTSSAGEFQVLGTAAADSTAIIGHWAAAATGGKMSFVKSRNATIGSSTIVQDNDLLGTIEFMADDGSDFATPAASIFSRVNGTPGANDMPGELVLAVTADAGNAVTERVRILQNGTVELNSATLSFDAAASIDTSGNNNLGISAGTADVQITAATIDLNGAVAMDGAITGGTNITISGELDAATLDISGNADIDGTLAVGDIAIDTVSIYATDIIIGEDSDTAISFKVPNQIDFRANGGTERLTLNSSALYPASDNAIDLGTSSLEFKDAFFDGTVTTDALTASGAVSTGALTSTSLNVSDGNITNVADIALDSISSDAGTSINVVLGSDAGDDFTVDTTKLVVEGDTGNVGIGRAAPGFPLEVVRGGGHSELQVSCWSDNTGTEHIPVMSFQKSTNDTIGTFTATATNKILGSIIWNGVNSSSASSSAGRIQLEQDGNAGSTYIPGRLVFNLAGEDNGVTERMRITNGGSVLIGDTANGNSTRGLTINQGTNDDHILTFKSDDLGAGTVSNTEPEDFGIFRKEAGPGGLAITGKTHNTTLSGVSLMALCDGFATTAKSTSATAMIEMRAYEHDGSGAYTAVVADGNLWSVRGSYGSSDWLSLIHI